MRFPLALEVLYFRCLMIRVVILIGRSQFNSRSGRSKESLLSDKDTPRSKCEKLQSNRCGARLRDLYISILNAEKDYAFLLGG